MENEQIHMLIVDDQKANREAMSRHLEQMGHTVTAAEGGVQALSMISTRQFDLVLLDINMPGLDGYQTLERLKADSTVCHIPVIMLADAEEVGDIDRCIEMGAADYLLEPLNLALLRLRIDTCLEKQRSRLQEQKDSERLAHDLTSIILPLGIALSGESNFDRLTERIVEAAMSLCNADGSVLYMRTQDDLLRPAVMRCNTLGFKAGGTTGKESPLPTLPLYTNAETGESDHSNLIIYTTLAGKASNISDIYNAEEFDSSDTRAFDKENNYRSISCLAIPLRDSAKKIIGVLHLFNAQDQKTGEVIPFDSYVQQIVSTLAIQSSIALSNQLLMKREEDLLKFTRELQIGREIQKSFLPDELPEFPGWEIAACFDPARNVGGDFYDAFPLTQNRRLGIVIADVCDKGVGAALFMGLIRSLVRAFAQQHHSLSWMDALSSGRRTAERGRSGRRQLPSVGIGALKNGVVLTNNYIANNHGESGMFATLFFGVLDPSTGRLAYINGGHEPPVIIGPDGVQKEILNTTGPAVGAFPDMEFDIQEAQFDPGDILFACTDGVTDAENPYRERFGKERLASLLEKPFTSAATMLERIESRLRSYIAYAEQFDDITMLAVRRAASSETQ